MTETSQTELGLIDRARYFARLIHEGNPCADGYFLERIADALTASLAREEAARREIDELKSKHEK